MALFALQALTCWSSTIVSAHSQSAELGSRCLDLLTDMRPRNSPSDQTLPAMGTPASMQAQNSPATPAAAPTETPLGHSGCNKLLQMISSRAADEKSIVRKAAMCACEALVRTNVASAQRSEWISLLAVRTSDMAVSVRKQALDSLSSLLSDDAEDETLQKAWKGTCLPMVTDRESSVQDRALSWLMQLVTDRIAAPNPKVSSPAWRLLHHLSDEEIRLLHISFETIGRKQPSPLTPKLVSTIISSMKGMPSLAERRTAWMVLEALSKFFGSKVDVELLQSSWREVCKRSESTELASTEVEAMGRHVLAVIANIATHLPKVAAASMADNLSHEVLTLRHGPGLIQPMLRALVEIDMMLSAGEKLGRVQQTCDKLVEMTAPVIHQFLSNSFALSSDAESTPVGHRRCGEQLWNVQHIIRCIFSVGEAALIPQVRIPDALATAVHALVTPIEHHVSEPSQSERGQPGSQERHSGEDSPCNVSAADIHAHASHAQLLRGHALVALGKMCLSNLKLTKSVLPMLVRELETDASPVVRNNILVLLCDLCVKYTMVVDKYIGRVASCLTDVNELVRKNCLTLLTTLLNTEFVKWKDSLFFRFVAVLVDDSADCREMGKLCLVQMVQTKFANVIPMHFVEVLWVLNGITSHPSYNKFQIAQNEKPVFSLPGGGIAARKRWRIYRTLLQQCTDEQRFNLTGKICHDILGAFAEGTLNLCSADGNNWLLYDALVVLASKEIKLVSRRGTGTNDETEEESAMNIARGKLISELVKKNMMENVVPIFVQLKAKLEAQRSPLIGAMMNCLRELLKEYQQEIGLLLAGSPQVAKEIEYDLRMVGKQQQVSLENPTDDVLTFAAGLQPSAPPTAKENESPNRPARSQSTPAKVGSTPMRLWSVTSPVAASPAAKRAR